MQTVTQAILSRDGGAAKLRSAVTTARAGVRARQTRLPHKTYALVGGPYENAVVSLSDTSTAVFTIGDAVGFYAERYRVRDWAIVNTYDRMRGAKPPRVLFWQSC